MSTDLALNDVYLADLKAKMDESLELFRTAPEDSGTIASVVGHAGLESRTREFYTNWNTKRTELITMLEELSDATKTVADTFAAADQQLRDSATAMLEAE